MSQNDIEAKIQTALSYKAQGNEAFGAKQYQEALRCYHHAVLVRVLPLTSQYLSGLDEGILAGLTGQSHPTSQGTRDDKIQLSQMAACYLQLQQWDKALDACDKALALDATNKKAIFRKAQALRQRGDMYKARAWLASSTAQPFLSDVDFAREQARIEALILTRERQSAHRLRGFLS